MNIYSIRLWSFFLLDQFCYIVSRGAGNKNMNVEFRDLICFECRASPQCPKRRYREPLPHLVTGCQACYKEWEKDSNEAIRKCFYPADILELSDPNTTRSNMCGMIENNNKESYYCFCFDDYCNHGNRRTLSPGVQVGAVVFLLAGNLAIFRNFCSETQNMERT